MNDSQEARKFGSFITKRIEKTGKKNSQNLYGIWGVNNIIVFLP